MERYENKDGVVIQAELVGKAMTPFLKECGLEDCSPGWVAKPGEGSVEGQFCCRDEDGNVALIGYHEFRLLFSPYKPKQEAEVSEAGKEIEVAPEAAEELQETPEPVAAELKDLPEPTEEEA